MDDTTDKMATIMVSKQNHITGINMLQNVLNELRLLSNVFGENRMPEVANKMTSLMLTVLGAKNVLDNSYLDILQAFSNDVTDTVSYLNEIEKKLNKILK